jgi:1-deoxy-D-xylulose-5-phosphate reductoisomerase
LGFDVSVSAVRKIAILGATGSVGNSTLDLVARNPDQYDVLALTARSDVEGLARAAKKVGARRAVVADPDRYQALRDALAGSGVEASAGEEAIIEAAGSGADWTMAAIVGSAGLKPAMAALRQGSILALANKESLVSAGDIMTSAAAKAGTQILPVDSEHNAIFQCLDRQRPAAVRRIILTASGGPFLRKTTEEMRGMSPRAAVSHPNWSMGAKISVDSATLMNKGLELIEAYHLFHLGHDAFDVLVHPESVVHSLVEYIDGSMLAQLGAPDMRIPIAYALAWPERMETPCARLDLAAVATLHFEEPDVDRFPALALARAALRSGGAKPGILNAANEIAVGSFLDNRIGFLDIVSVSRGVLDTFDPPAASTLEDVLEIDRRARDLAGDLVRSISR